MSVLSSSGKRKISAEEPEQNDLFTDEMKVAESDSIQINPINPINSTFSIAIVGGGIAGLGAALALQQKGFKVKVYERDVLFEDRRQGYGLTLTNNPKGPLADLDLLNECIARDCPSNAHWIFAPSGNVLGYYGRSFKNKEGLPSENSSLPGDCQIEGRGNLRIPRQNLRRMMLERLQPNTVRWGMKLLDYTEDLNGVQIQFQTSRSSKSDEISDDTAGGSSESNDGIEGMNAQNTTNITNVTNDRINKSDTNNVEEISADILVGADGIRSMVRQLRGKKVGVQGNNKLITESSPLHYVGVAVILGITTATHPLINQQGFYCLDGTNRLFTMPFEDGDAKPWVPAGAKGSSCDEGSSGEEGSTDADSADESKMKSDRDGSGPVNHTEHTKDAEGKMKLTMWQLSFSDYTEEEGALLRSAGPQELLNEALRRCKGWFDPVSDMIRCTPEAEVWGTGLYDRDPMPLRGKDQGSRVTVIGDACHPMSMFKGQGANQALHDGPLLASWLDSGSGSVAAVRKSQKSQKIQRIERIESNKYNNEGNERNSKVVSTELTAHNVYTRLRCFEREMVARTSSKVQASREAATRLHSPAVLSDSFRVEGVRSGGENTVLLKNLEVMNVGAHLSNHLEGKLRIVLNELQSDII